MKDSAHKSVNGDSFTRTRFEWLDQMAADPSISAAAFKLAYVVSRHINRMSGTAWPTQKSLGRLVGMGERGVRKLVEQLAAAGHLQVTVQRGREKPNVYRMILKNRNGGSSFDDGKEEQEGRFSDIKPEQERQKNRNGCALKPERPFRQNPLKEPLEGTLISRGTVVPLPVRGNAPARASQETRQAPEAEFLEWYAHYPKKVGKGAARKAYFAARKKVGQAELIAGVLRYAAARDGQDPQYTKAPAVWLNQECWDDDPAAYERRQSVQDVARRLEAQEGRRSGRGPSVGQLLFRNYGDDE